MRARLVLIPIAIAAALVAGCETTTPGADPSASAPAAADNGVAALTAEEILQKATKAMTEAGPVRISGSTVEDGNKVTIDYQLSGEDLAGKVESTEFAMEIIKVGNDVYMKLPAEMLFLFSQQIPESALEALKDKYLKFNASDSKFSSLADLADPDQVLAPEGTVTKGETKTINGTPAIGLLDEKAGNTLYIATVGEPRPLQIESTSGDTINFEYGGTADIKAPDAAQVVDISAFVKS